MRWLMVSLLALGLAGCEDEPITYYGGTSIPGSYCPPVAYEVCPDANGLPTCTDTLEDPANCGACGVVCVNSICAFGVCQGASFSCAAVGLDTCDGYCTDLARDRFNCGACGRACPPDFLCALGSCHVAGFLCADIDLVQCGFGCTNVQLDPLNCGQCGHVCPTGCASGVCR